MRVLPTTLVLVLLAVPLSSSQSGLDLMDVDILFVGAHPDDDTGILATFARYLLDEGYRGTVLTATGGDGGGNATGPEAGRALALIRKEEERRALALVGVDAPSFLGLQDFYFTLSAEETLRKWGDSFVCDVVRHVRLQRPEVIVTMWPGPGTHGQHQMAARAATIAFEKAPDASYCPELTERELLAPFEPLKLYYYDRDGEGSVAIPTSDISPSRYMSYAEIKALGFAMYRSQGFDRFARIPVPEPAPERFQLIRSRAPVSLPESHLLAGASPSGISLLVEPERFEVGIGLPLDVEVTMANRTGSLLTKASLALEAPPGFRIESTADAFTLLPGERKSSTFRIVPGPGVALDKNLRVAASYRAEQNGRELAGDNFTWIRARPPVRVRFAPLYDVASYREFARETKTEWVIETLPTRVPLYVGRTNTVEIELSNASEEAARGTASLELPPGLELVGRPEYEVPPRGTARLPLSIRVTEEALPNGRRSAKLPITVRTEIGGHSSLDTGDAYLLPSLVIPRVTSPPTVDGDLSDMEGYASGEITPEDLWWRRKPDGAADSSAAFFLAYDEAFFYAGVRVRDDVVVCNIAPDDVRAQLRSDAVGITIDPAGKSRDTGSVLQAAAFPCTTVGFGARGFRDADANQGLMEETAPGMEVASRRMDDGYTFETKIPWAAMPSRPSPGDEIAVNVVIYDGDAADARVGANVSESGIAWAAFEWGGKQALPYLWPRVVLGPVR
jgi:LmbE family N-acetylglucosaminyl deacetylase